MSAFSFYFEKAIIWYTYLVCFTISSEKRVGDTKFTIIFFQVFFAIVLYKKVLTCLRLKC